MEIFNKQLFGDCADEFLKLTTCQKKEWIKKHTNQQNDELILEFIKVATKGKECKCLDCGKERKDANISKANEPKVADSSERELVKKPSKRNSTKRPKEA